MGRSALHGFGYTGESMPGLTRKRKTIAVDAGDSPEANWRAQRLPGARWHSKSGSWIISPAYLPEAVQLCRRFDFDVPADMSRYNDGIIARRRALEALSLATHTDFEPTPIEVELRDYQRVAVQYALATRRCIIGDEPGLGKTIETIATVETASAYPALVVCPPKLTLNWAAEIMRCVPKRTVQVVSSRSDVVVWSDWTVIGWSNIASICKCWVTAKKGEPPLPVPEPCALHRLRPETLVLDESHLAKNPDAQRTKAVTSIADTIDTGLVLLLTGTPVKSRPSELIPQLEIAGTLQSTFGTKSVYESRFCKAVTDSDGSRNTDGADHLAELHRRLRASTYLRRTKAEVMDDLPPAEIRPPFDCEMGKDERKVYDAASDDVSLYLAERAAAIAEELGLNPYAAAVQAKMRAESAFDLVRFAVLRKLAAMAKIPTVVEWTQSRLDADEKVILAVQHRDVADALSARFGGLKIIGGMSTKKVEENKARFQNDRDPDSMVIVVNYVAGGTGHTLTAAREVGLVELPWTPDELAQIIGRAHRFGQTAQVYATIFRAPDTIDDVILRTLARKAEVVHGVHDGGDNELRAVETVAASLVDQFRRPQGRT